MLLNSVETKTRARVLLTSVRSSPRKVMHSKDDLFILPKALKIMILTSDWKYFKLSRIFLHKSTCCVYNTTWWNLNWWNPRRWTQTWIPQVPWWSLLVEHASQGENNCVTLKVALYSSRSHLFSYIQLIKPFLEYDFRFLSLAVCIIWTWNCVRRGLVRWQVGGKFPSLLKWLIYAFVCLFDMLSRVSLLPYSKDFLSYQHYSIPHFCFKLNVWILSNMFKFT